MNYKAKCEKLEELFRELRCDINYCKVSFTNDTEIKNAEETLKKLESELAELDKQESIKEKIKEHISDAEPVVSKWIREDKEKDERQSAEKILAKITGHFIEIMKIDPDSLGVTFREALKAMQEFKNT